MKWFVVLFILACSAGTVSVAQPSSAPFIDVVNTDAVKGDLFARDFRAGPSCNGLTVAAGTPLDSDSRRRTRTFVLLLLGSSELLNL
jgi:hypothetical protein